jgi:hypothetical protein
MTVVTRRRLWVVMAIMGVAVAAWCAPGAWARATYGARVTADEPQYLLSALSLAEDQGLDIADERAEGRFRDFHEASLPLQEKTQADGSRVSPHDPLLPVLLAAPMGIGGWLAAKLLLAALAGVLAAALVWVAVRRFDVPIGIAALTVATFALAAPFAVYGTQVYPELAAALAVTVAVGALTGPLTRRGLVVLVVAVVVLPWLSVKYAPVAVALVGLGAWRCWRRGDRRAVLVGAGVLALAGAVFLVAHQALYGGWTPYAAGDHFVGGELTVSGTDPDYLGRSVRLLGLLVDRGFGLAAWQPAYLLAIPAFAALAVRRPRGWAVLAVPLAVGWLNATFVALTMHGWWWPGRQLVVVLPCAVLGIAWWAARSRGAVIAVAVGCALGALTFAWLLVDVVGGHNTLIVDFERTTNPLVRAWREVLPEGRLVPAGTDALRLAWLAVLALLGWWGVRSVGRGRRDRSTPMTAPPSEAIVTQPNGTSLERSLV